MTMPKFLVAVDGSSHAKKAVRTLVAQAGWYKTPPEIVLITVHRPVPPIHGLGRSVGKVGLERYYQEEGEAALAECRKILDAAGVPYKTEIAVGDIAETIAAKARAHKCELIVMGSRGLGATANVFLGSVATRVLHLADVPVTLVR